MSPDEENEYIRRNYLAELRKEVIARKQRDWYIRALCLSLHQHGATWQQIGESLGVSSQAAWKQYRSKAPQKILPGQGPYHIEKNG